MFIAVRDAEAKLYEMVTSVENNPGGWRAMHFRFSRLMEHYKSDYQLKIATNLVTDILGAEEGGVFICADKDVFVLCQGIARSKLEKVIFQLRYLFSEDPVAYQPDGKENPDFCEISDLSIDWLPFRNLVKNKITIQAKMEAEKPKHKAGRDGEEPHDKNMTPAVLAGVERDLKQADLTPVMRFQPVYAAVPGKKIRPVFQEVYVNIGHLGTFVSSGVNLVSNRFLFGYLTEVLDLKVLEMLGRRPDVYFRGPVSLNLNIVTLLSHAFTEFDSHLSAAMRKQLIVELQAGDIFSNMQGFLAARDMLAKQGYRLCLDGLSRDSFLQMDREGLGLDMMKLQWNAEIESDLKTQMGKNMQKAVKACGPNRVILCRCDSRQAIDYGQALGINLFQGRALDKAMQPGQRKEN